MFAVPGWSVSASTLVKETAKSRDKAASKDGFKHNSKVLDKSKKRKRDQAFNPSNESAERHPTSNSATPNRGLDSNEPLQDLKTPPTVPHNDKTDREPAGIQRSKKSKAKQATKHSTRPQKTVSHETNGYQNRDDTVDVPSNSLAPIATTKLTPLQMKMRNKLTSARFRHLNETLYTSPSAHAMTMFTESPDLFAEYHAGFSQQVKTSWPQNPVVTYIRMINERGKINAATGSSQPLPRRKTGSCTIADLGCGDAPLARGCQANVKLLKLKFHNYDLHAPNTFVTKADISDLPLRDGEADIAVFCLSLMGTNWISFVEEAWRILRGDGKGEVWVAEVKSRFGRITRGHVVENSVGKRRKKPKPLKDEDDVGYDGPEQFIEDERTYETDQDETDISAFVKVFTRRGFQLQEQSVKKGNKMFVSMIFTKSGIPTAGKHKGLKWNGKEYAKQQEGKVRFSNNHKADEITPEDEAKVLKPCVYKTR